MTTLAENVVEAARMVINLHGMRIEAEWHLWRQQNKRPKVLPWQRIPRMREQEEWDCIDYVMRAFVAETCGYDPAYPVPDTQQERG